VIIVHGKTSVSPTIRSEFIDSARRSVPLTRAEAGNLSYVISTDILDAEAFHLFEIWDSAASLRSHSSAPHQIVRRRELETLGVSWREIDVYSGDPYRITQ
jgi:quinol monooxygenase YgiN